MEHVLKFIETHKVLLFRDIFTRHHIFDGDLFEVVNERILVNTCKVCKHMQITVYCCGTHTKSYVFVRNCSRRPNRHGVAHAEWRRSRHACVQGGGGRWGGVTAITPREYKNDLLCSVVTQQILNHRHIGSIHSCRRFAHTCVNRYSQG